MNCWPHWKRPPISSQNLIASPAAPAPSSAGGRHNWCRRRPRRYVASGSSGRQWGRSGRVAGRGPRGSRDNELQCSAAAAKRAAPRRPLPQQQRLGLVAASQAAAGVGSVPAYALSTAPAPSPAAPLRRLHSAWHRRSSAPISLPDNEHCCWRL